MAVALDRLVPLTVGGVAEGGRVAVDWLRPTASVPSHSLRFGVGGFLSLPTPTFLRPPSPICKTFSLPDDAAKRPYVPTYRALRFHGRSFGATSRNFAAIPAPVVTWQQGSSV